MKNLLLLIFCLPAFLTAQDREGIMFEQNKMWKDVLSMAKNKNKFIFVDCYATWCGPCKQMENDVFSKKLVGQFMNANFVSVRVQIDSTFKDDLSTKSWYSDAKAFVNEYEINRLPCYLFFSPSGNIVHKGVNAVSTHDFLRIARHALDPNQQYYTQLRMYQSGLKSYESMRYLATLAKSFGEDQLAYKIAVEYKEAFLDKTNDSLLYNKAVLDFVTRDFFDIFYAEGTKGRLFNLFLNNPEKVDSVGGFNGFSSYMIKSVIKKEEVRDKLYYGATISSKKPNWDKLEGAVRKKYGDRYIHEIFLPAKMEFYRTIGDWKKYSKVLDNQIQLHSLSTNSTNLYTDDPIRISDPWALNSAAWTVFLYCDDRQILLRAISWSDLSIKLEYPNPNVQYFDTKANLLYKLGYVNDAIECEKHAIKIDNYNAIKKGRIKGGFVDEYTETVNKMINGEPTWIMK